MSPILAAPSILIFIEMGFCNHLSFIAFLYLLDKIHGIKNESTRVLILMISDLGS